MGSTESLADRAAAGPGPAPAPREPSERGVASPSAVQRVHRSTDAVEEQLRRVEERLVTQAEGDPDALLAVRAHLTAARARFRDARIQQFLPILVEREVRRRMRGDGGPA